MTRRAPCLFYLVASGCALFLLPWPYSASSASSAPSAVQGPSEDAYRANNLGVALLEQFDYPAAAEAFRRALSLDPALGLARMNLAVALYNARDLEGARREAGLAASELPDRPHPHYILGLVAKAENRTDDAIAGFSRVVEMDPADVGGNVNLGQMYMQLRRYPEAIATFRAAAAAEPYSQTAVYNLGIALTRAGLRAEGETVMERFKELRDSGYRTVLGQNYLEQGRYAEALSSTGAEPELVSRDTPAVTFADATSEALPAELRAGSGAGQVSLADLDGDGALDLLVAGEGGLRIYRNEEGRFTAAGGGALGTGAYLAVVAGDYDNDGKPDLLALGTHGLALYHNQGGLRFKDVTAAAALGAAPAGTRAIAFSDFDHDGDLDVVAGLLWRNNGDGTFADVTAAAGLAGAGAPLALVPTDFDNRRDVDLLLAPEGAPVRLYRNMRDGTFRDVAGEVGLKGASSAVAAGDVNKDEFTDFYLGAADGPGVVALSDGRGRFVASPAPAALAGARAAQFLDYDADGLLDLLVLTGGGPRLLRNTGGSWTDVSAAALAAARSVPGTALASGDLDGDGDTDVVVRLTSGGLRLWRNEGGSRNHSVRVRLAGQVSNRSSVGAKVEARAGSLRQKIETYAASPAPAPADVVFGLGPRAFADAVRVLWPAGILQTETAVAAADGRPATGGAPLVGATTITELDRKPSSCPYLYAWDGERFAFVTDFMGGGEMGYRHANGAFNHPDPDEYVRLTAEQLRPRDGRLELRVTNELEEVLFLDRVRMLAVDHPAGVEVHPHEGLVGARGGRPFRLFAAVDARPVARARDDHGHDVTARLEHVDRSYPDDFAKRPLRGYAEEHGLTLDLGAGAHDLLLLTGWTDYAFSSDNVAAQQAGLALRPPSLQVKDGAGRWQTVIEEVGIPVGRPQTLVADLRGLWRGPSREVRIATNMRIYWDRIQVARAAPTTGLTTTTVEPATADLRWRGFSAELTPDGREPFAYAYERVAAHSPWKVFPGRYTREGDVRPLLLATDDMFVVSRPGDEIAVSFDASALPPLPAGWTRTWLFYSYGYSKEMDLNSASPDAVEPLPFQAMSRYPYEAPEAYPLTPERRRYLERYNTRVVARPVPGLDLALARPPE